MVLSKDDILYFEWDYPHGMEIEFTGTKVVITKGWFRMVVNIEDFTDQKKKSVADPNNLKYSVEHQLINQTTHFSAN